MPVSHVLHRVQGFDTADGASAQQLVQRAVEFGIAQHMAHHHHAVRLMRFFLQCKAFVQQRRNGFFQHKVIALVQRGQRLRHMLAVLRGNDHHIRKARLGQQLFACGKTASGGHAVIRLQCGAAVGIRVGPGGDLHFFRVLLLEGGIRLQPADAQAADGKCNGFVHGSSSFLFFADNSAAGCGALRTRIHRTERHLSGGFCALLR